MSHAVRAGVSVPAAAATQEREAEPAYEGLVTRSIAFALDAAVVNLVAIVVATGLGLALTVLHLPQEVEVALVACGGATYVLWSVGYFVLFWSSTGQTPGNRVMRIRVCMAEDGRPPRPARALLRLGALFVAAVPLFAGFLLILVDSRRRGLQDMLAGTVVVAAPGDAPAPIAPEDAPAPGRDAPASGRPAPGRDAPAPGRDAPASGRPGVSGRAAGPPGASQL